jgi:AcrR family transcriptional regulator
MRRQPAQSRSQKKVQEILAAARRVLIARGYEQFTTNHVAGEAGCNISTLYRYFPDKDAIIRALYQGWLSDEKALNSAAVAALDGPVEAAGFAGALFRTHLDSHSEEDHALSVELTKALYLSSEVRGLDEAYDREFVDTVAAHLQEYTDQSFSRAQIGFVLKLAVSLLIMINRAGPDERPELIEMSVQTLEAAIRSWR